MSINNICKIIHFHHRFYSNTYLNTSKRFLIFLLVNLKFTAIIQFSLKKGGIKMLFFIATIIVLNLIVIAKVNNWAADVKKFEKNNRKNNIHFIN